MRRVLRGRGGGPDRGEVMLVPTSGGLVPDERVCIRAVQRGEGIEGNPVAMERCCAR